MHRTELPYASAPLIYMLTYAVVASATGIQIAKGLRRGYGEIRTLLVEPGVPRPHRR